MKVLFNFLKAKCHQFKRIYQEKLVSQMKQIDQSQLITSSTIPISTSLPSYDLENKYDDIFDKSFQKRVRTAFYALFNHIAAHSPDLLKLHDIITIWRILQYFWVSLAPDSIYAWGEGTVSYNVLSNLSVLFQILPVSVRESASALFLFLFSLLFLGFIIFLAICSFYFQKYARIPAGNVYFIVFFFSTFGHLVPQAVAAIGGSHIGRMIGRSDEFLNFWNVFVTICAFVVLFAFLWIHFTLYSASIIFKSDSLPTVTSTCGAIISILFMLSSFFMGIAGQVEYVPRVVLTVAAIIMYAFSIPGMVLNGGLVYENQAKALLSASDTAIISIIIILIVEEYGLFVHEYLFLVVSALWIAFYVLNHYIYRRIICRNVKILNSLEENESLLEKFNHEFVLIDLIVSGFRVSHPLCLSFKMPQLAVTKFPKSPELWMIYAKFVAIYPEYSQQLIFLVHGIKQNRVRGSVARYTCQQVQVIMRQRETNLIPEMKIKIDKLNKQVQSTKHKLRYIWDLIIQSNVKELSGIVDRAADSISTCQTEFHHLLHQYPNSRFVARSYARFLRDVLADHANYKIWIDNVSLLQRGISVGEDMAHKHGLIAFPTLPQSIDPNLINSQGIINISMTDDNITQEIIENEEDKLAIDAEIRMSINEGIRKLSIPSFRIARISRIMMFLILFIGFVTACFIYTSSFLSHIITPIGFLYQIALLRTVAFQAIGCGMHYIMENLNAYDPLHKINTLPMKPNGFIEDQEIPPESIGGFYDSRLQTEFFLRRINQVIPHISSLIDYISHDKRLSNIREAMYGYTFRFVDVSEPQHLEGWTESTTNENLTKYDLVVSNKSVISAIMQFSILYNKMLMLETIPNDALNWPYFSTPFNNARNISERLSEILEMIIEFIIKEDDKNRHMLTILLIIVIVIVPTLYIISSIYIYFQTSKDETLIYRCLTSLPKNVVSRVVDTMKIIKKEEGNDKTQKNGLEDEMSKQEDNILKLFSTSARDEKIQNDITSDLTITTFVVILCHMAITILTCLFMFDSSTIQKTVAPLIDCMMGAYAFDFASLVILLMLPSSIHPYPIYHIYNYNAPKLVYVIKDWQNKSLFYYKAFRYGNKDANIVSTQSVLNIQTVQLNQSCAENIVPNNIHQGYSCFPPDMLFQYSQQQVRKYLTQFENLGEAFSGNDTLINHLWHIHQVHLYDQYFSNIFDDLLPLVMGQLSQKQPFLIFICTIIIVIAASIEIYLSHILKKYEDKQKFSLRLLLHCPGEVVIANRYISALLSGNFNENKLDIMSRDEEFYDVLVKDMIDSIIIIGLDKKIISINNASKRIYDIDIDKLIGENISVIGDRFMTENPFLKITELMDTEERYWYDGGDRGELHLIVSFRNLGDSYLITTHDETQTVMYNMLISDEKAKTDQLLATILPAKLIPRVQAGEKNISFAVQTDTIVFMDIVSFTPWCGSLPAATVMKTLNILFKEYDSLLALRPTMTKIKCIGDCYMAAGGIFAELNQPSVHSKEVVEFGLDSILSLEKINEEIEQSLQIRVGVNTGGPIVAGVLGTDKPTFEILGPTINMAQQMEHHGVPMKVHISRSVYELIYGSNFNVKEKGETIIKDIPTITYIVSPNKK
ncbi:Adenylate and Guanylate cyclase catalytic domain containing protein [Tritrichomonas foetus]|uniref:Adenylate and Guanylate cyclase catalytic domain containing protein n=1 Tax=Tritrichomonas foetus TaxID=1144522 RepID=A0A1J4KHF4_9EUKA|nr:Adenylate and Guanylate cyclase catalytic domain containing protein [Tritrichomonas foetus]|eukprot:OHT10801.1 Adenylate and Guanylate cyclase catalytic domain containing protein [Tritrichomonas foetus]